MIFRFQCSLRPLEIPVGQLEAGPKERLHSTQKLSLREFYGLYRGNLGWRVSRPAGCRIYHLGFGGPIMGSSRGKKKKALV